MTRVLTDFHHSGLLRSLQLLFENRLGTELYRPIGMEWFQEGYWAINDQRDTAYQYLNINAAAPIDGTPALNTVDEVNWHTYKVQNPGGTSHHMACTLEYFKSRKFDYVIASIPDHIPIFQRMIERFQPAAKLIVQMGNNWDLESYAGYNVLASLKPQFTSANACFYHQEIDQKYFYPQPYPPISTRGIVSFINILQNTGQGWSDFRALEQLLARHLFTLKSYGGQCRDGNMTGDAEVAQAMRAASMVFHVKPGGDGFGHIIHDAYAMGRVVITRPSHYRDQLAEQLLVPGTYIDLDKLGRAAAAEEIARLNSPEGYSELAEMGQNAAQRFKEVVNYDKDQERVSQWLSAL